MTKSPRRKVVRFEMRRPFPTWRAVRHAILECGHILRCSHAPKSMACYECGPGQAETVTEVPK